VAVKAVCMFWKLERHAKTPERGIVAALDLLPRQAG